MQSLRDIRRHIKSIDSTRQIARAMEMISAARLKRAQERLLSVRPYTEGMDTIVKRVCSKSVGATHPFLVRRDTASVGICVVASDRGLCGAYNISVIREAERLARKIEEGGAREAARVHFLPVGRKAFLHFRRKEARLTHFVPELGSSADRELAAALSGKLIDFYVQGTLDEIWLVFTHFISSGTRQVITQRLLPLDVSGTDGIAGGHEYIYEPEAPVLLEALLPNYLTTKVFTVFAESCASEHSARMVAMTFATKNADDMVDALTLLSNRARQSSITREIADIVGTAEVLR